MNRRISVHNQPTPHESTGPLDNVVLDLARVWQILLRGWWIIAICAFLGALIAAVVMVRTPPTFSAKAQIMLGQANRADDTLGNLFQELNLDNADIAGEIAIITSGQTLTGVSELLDLAAHPEFNTDLQEEVPPSFVARIVGGLKDGVKALLGGDPAPEPGTGLSSDADDPVSRAAAAGRDQFGAQADYVGTLAAGLKVKQVGSTYLVDIAYASNDRQLAAAVPNAVVDVYLREQLNRKFNASQQVAEGLNSRLEVLRERLEASERALIDYRNRNLAAGFGSQERLEQQLRELSSRLGTATAERAALSSELAEIDALIARGGLTAAAGLFSSGQLENLRSELVTAEQNLSQLSDRFDENSPQITEIGGRIRQLEAAMETEVARLRNDKVNLEAVASAREAALQSQMLTLEQQELRLSERAVTMAQLERELEVNRVTYETFLGKFTETSEVVDLQQADAQVISYAQLPKSPIAPRKKLGVALGLLAGATLGMGLVFFRSIGDSVVSSAAQLRGYMQGAHVVALPRLRGLLSRPDPTSYVLQEPQSALSESIRALRSYLLLSKPAGPSGHTMAIVSCRANAGKSTTSVMLGRSMVQMGKSCVLVETDLRAGNIAKIMNIPFRPDLVDVLQGTATLDEALQPDPHSNMFVLNARTKLKDPAALLMSARMADLVKRLEEKFDVVIFDTAPLLSISDAVPLVGMADNVVLLAREGETTTTELDNALRLLRSSSANLTCCALSLASKQKNESFEYY